MTRTHGYMTMAYYVQNVYFTNVFEANEQINNLRQLLKFALRALESFAEFLHSLISKVIVRQVQLVDDALGHEHRRELFAAVFSEAAVTQTEIEQRSHSSLK